VRFGENHGIQRNFQFRGYLPGWVAIEPEPEERLPGGRLEIRLHDLKQSFNHVLVVVSVPLASKLSVRVGKLFKKFGSSAESVGARAAGESALRGRIAS